MWREMPDQQLEYINRRHAELISEAASDHFAGRPAPNRSVHGERGFTGLHFHLGTLLIVIGRTLCDDEPLRHDAAHS